MDIHSGARVIRTSACLSILAAFVWLASAAGCQNIRDESLSADDASVPVEDAGTPVPYTVECGQVDDDGEPFCYVDRGTYIGWRTFHGFCHVCHAQDAVGSTFAPPLIDRIGEMDFELFVERTANGYTGEVGVMPPWKDNPNVNKRYEELYSYLRARADGALPRGRPKRFP